MLFTTDNQTLDDLNIFGKPGTASIYTIFNHCKTRGGEAVLSEMFRYPLSDDGAINRRSGIIHFFAESATVFPFQSAHFDHIEPYLANTDERTKLTDEEGTLVQKLGKVIAQDEEVQQVYRGVQSLVDLLKDTRKFICDLDIPDTHVYAEERQAIRSILLEPAFALVLESQEKLDQRTFADFDAILRFKFRKQVLTIFRYLYNLDVYISVAQVANKFGFVLPKALPKGQMSVTLKGMYHPQVPNAVANNISITPENNVIFLTGANMAGKSTFMKSLSIAMYLAHMGFPVAAQKMDFSVLDGIYTTINLPDNIARGASHFYAEVLRVKKVAQELGTGKNFFVLFDELFRGTNVKDAYEATIAITKGFARKTNSIFVISTHIIEAADVLKEACSNICFMYLPTEMEGNQVKYTYTLKKGVTNDRHGMVIINNEGILDILEAGLKNLK